MTLGKRRRASGASRMAWLTAGSRPGKKGRRPPQTRSARGRRLVRRADGGPRAKHFRADRVGRSRWRAVLHRSAGLGRLCRASSVGRLRTAPPLQRPTALPDDWSEDPAYLAAIPKESAALHTGRFSSRGSGYRASSVSRSRPRADWRRGVDRFDVRFSRAAHAPESEHLSSVRRGACRFSARRKRSKASMSSSIRQGLRWRYFSS